MVAEPVGTPATAREGVWPEGGHGRAGRNLPVAVGVGVGLALLVTVPLFTYKPVFVGVVVVVVSIGTVEFSRAVWQLHLRVPTLPMTAGGAAMMVLAYLGGPEALLLALVATALASAAWRLLDGAAHGRLGLLRDVAVAGFILVYVPFLAGFCLLLAMPSDGPRRVTCFLAVTAACDIGGYAAGVLAGRHLMARSVSPKKTWEGLAGSLVACVVAGALLVSLLLHTAVWQGALFGLAVVPAAVLGDLGESMIKRDIGIKDMGRLLPGHGGAMERLDSVLLTAPVAWLLLSAFAPTG